MKKIISLFLFMMFAGGLYAAPQNDIEKTEEPEGYKFTITKEIESTPVRNQSRSGTCWSFAANSFLESELLREGKGEHNLSEMWIVRHTYIEKAIKYVRLRGYNNFSAGGSFDDVFYIIDKYGIVPEEAYPGLNYGTDKHDHSELDAVLKGYVDGVIKGRKLTTAWLKGVENILDAYLGEKPEKFMHNGKEYTVESYTKSLGIDTDDYITIGSFTHHPFYEQFIIEIPDNWLWTEMQNIPLDEYMSIFDYAIDNGYTVCWASDVSEKGFAYAKGFAVVPEADVESMDGTEEARWVKLTEKERQDELYKFDKPGKEKTITQELRQEAYDNYETTDDHGMLIVGTADDQNGTPYYRVQNSWGTSQLYDGFFYVSKPFVAYKTVFITVHKDAVPKAILNKMKW